MASFNSLRVLRDLSISAVRVFESLFTAEAAELGAEKTRLSQYSTSGVACVNQTDALQSHQVLKTTKIFASSTNARGFVLLLPEISK